MPTQEQYNGVMKVQSYGLVEFLVELQDLIKQGYELDLATNESFPIQVGAAYFSAGLVKVGSKPAQKEPDVVSVEDTEKVDQEPVQETDTKPDTEVKATGRKRKGT